jgi:2-dehydro-3-deoxygalactonokinase
VVAVIENTHGAAVARLIALDWGTSSLRAWLLGVRGHILDTRRPDHGLLSTMADIDAADSAARARACEAVFLDVCGEWVRAHPTIPVIACGMVGSAQGWQEAGYLTVPTDLGIDAEALTAVRHGQGELYIVPGLRLAPDLEHVIPGDVIRGEETQVIGVLDLMSDSDSPRTVVLPGTHTKWLRIDNRKVISFTTAMSGELYGLVTGHGILGYTATTAVRDDQAFARGLAAASTAPSRGLAAVLFSARALALDGLLDPPSLPDYISGVIIADEVRHLLPEYADRERIVLCGNTDLCRRYAAALDLHGVATEVVGEETATRGLWTVATTAGLVEPSPQARRRTM